MKHRLSFLVAVGLLVFGIHSAYAIEDTSSSARSSSRDSQQSAMGTIEKITNDKITLRTEDGKTRSFTINQAQRDEIKSQSLREGDRIDLSLNKQNQVVSVNKSNETGGDRFNSNRGSGATPGANSPDTGVNPNSGTETNPNSGTGANPGTGGMGSNPETSTGGMSGSGR